MRSDLNSLVCEGKTVCQNQLYIFSILRISKFAILGGTPEFTELELFQTPFFAALLFQDQFFSLLLLTLHRYDKRRSVKRTFPAS
jgi:hypothetical protein